MDIHPSSLKDAAMLAAFQRCAAATPVEKHAHLAKGMMWEFAASTSLPAPLKLALAETATPTTDFGARITHAYAILDLCAAAGPKAGSFDTAERFVRRNTDLAAVRTDLIEARARADDAVELSTSLPPQSQPSKPASMAELGASVYGKRGL